MWIQNLNYNYESEESNGQTEILHHSMERMGNYRKANRSELALNV